MMTDAQLKDQILETLEEIYPESTSLTKLSKMLGFTKKNERVSNITLELLDSGRVLEDDENPAFLKYQFNNELDESDNNSDVDDEDDDFEDDDWDDEDDDEEDEPVDDGMRSDEIYVFDPTSATIPEDDHGYEIEEQTHGFAITLPSGTKHAITKSERILVINEERHFKVTKPEDILMVIDEYSRHNGFKNYIIKDLSLGRVVEADAINTNPCLIFISVERYSKAGDKKLVNKKEDKQKHSSFSFLKNVMRKMKVLLT